jgi:hypothetical protein
MKRLWMIVFLSLTAYAVFAQEDYELSEPDTILDLSKIHPSFPQLSAIKVFYRTVKDKAYVVQLEPHSISIKYRNAQYLETDPHYNEDFIDSHYPKLNLIGKEGLVKEAGKLFAKYLKPEDLEFGNSLHIAFACDLQGKILELIFSYPKQILLPIEAIAQLDTYIRTQCSIKFEPSPLYEGARYIHYITGFSFERIYQAAQGQ